MKFSWNDWKVKRGWISPAKPIDEPNEDELSDCREKTKNASNEERMSLLTSMSFVKYNYNRASLATPHNKKTTCTPPLTPTKCLRFSDKIDVVPVLGRKQMSREERKATWYSRKEIENLKQITLHVVKAFRNRDDDRNCDTIFSPKYGRQTGRGLERLTVESEGVDRFRDKRALIKGVIGEQNRQTMAGRPDPDKLASYSGLRSQRAKRIALRLAEKDAAAAAVVHQSPIRLPKKLHDRSRTLSMVQTALPSTERRYGKVAPIGTARDVIFDEFATTRGRKPTPKSAIDVQISLSPSSSNANDAERLHISISTPKRDPSCDVHISLSPHYKLPKKPKDGGGGTRMMKRQPSKRDVFGSLPTINMASHAIYDVSTPKKFGISNIQQQRLSFGFGWKRKKSVYPMSSSFTR